MNGILEVCVDSYASAMAAIAGGADQLELCSALSVGGLTPSAALLKQIRRVSNIPIRCLMRPRGGDFLYTPEEIEQMAMEMAVLRDAGADGFVVGCLTADEKGRKVITKEMLAEFVGVRSARFDNGGDRYYDLISAFHKSVRGSDPDAALYWFARIVTAGGDPLYVAEEPDLAVRHNRRGIRRVQRGDGGIRGEGPATDREERQGCQLDGGFHVISFT